MPWISAFAVFFIMWWVILFAILPFSLRTQEETDDITLGTISSAPGRPHMMRAVIRTTIVTAIVFGMFFVATRVYGLGIDDIPRIVPDFR